MSFLSLQTCACGEQYAAAPPWAESRAHPTMQGSGGSPTCPRPSSVGWSGKVPEVQHRAKDLQRLWVCRGSGRLASCPRDSPSLGSSSRPRKDCCHHSYLAAVCYQGLGRVRPVIVFCLRSPSSSRPSLPRPSRPPWRIISAQIIVTPAAMRNLLFLKNIVCVCLASVNGAIVKIHIFVYCQRTCQLT